MAGRGILRTYRTALRHFQRQETNHFRLNLQDLRSVFKRFEEPMLVPALHHPLGGFRDENSRINYDIDRTIHLGQPEQIMHMSMENTPGRGPLTTSGPLTKSKSMAPPPPISSSAADPTGKKEDPPSIFQKPVDFFKAEPTRNPTPAIKTPQPAPTIISPPSPTPLTTSSPLPTKAPESQQTTQTPQGLSSSIPINTSPAPPGPMPPPSASKPQSPASSRPSLLEVLQSYFQRSKTSSKSSSKPGTPAGSTAGKQTMSTSATATATAKPTITPQDPTLSITFNVGKPPIPTTQKKPNETWWTGFMKKWNGPTK